MTVAYGVPHLRDTIHLLQLHLLTTGVFGSAIVLAMDGVQLIKNPPAPDDFGPLTI